MQPPKDQIREDESNFTAFFCWMVCCFFVIVYCPFLKRTPNEAARRDLKG